MKKRFCTLISLLLIAALLAACTADVAGGESSLTDVSDAESESSAEASADTSSETSKEESAEESREPDVYTYYTAVSIGKSYTLTTAPSDTYPDSYNSELTNGLLAPAGSGYSFDGACGFNGNTNVIIDLGEDCTRINRIEVEYISTYTAGLAPLSRGTAYGSNDGTTYDMLGTLSIPKYEEGVQTATLDLANAVDYRYIKINCVKGGAWLFLSEVTVCADVEPNTENKLIDGIKAVYAELGLKNGDTQKGISAIVSGQTPDKSLTETLVSQSKDYTIADKTYDSRTTEIDGKLTDGNYGSGFEDGGWVGLDATKSNSITLSLGSVKDAYRFALCAYAYNNVGVYLPDYIDVYAGTKKAEMSFVGRVYSGCVSQGSFTYDIVLSSCVNANYVKFVIPAAEKGHYWFEEAAVFAYRTESTTAGKMVYDPVVLPEVTKDEYFSSSDKDYNDTIDLIKGLTQQIRAANELPYETYGGGNNNTPATSTLLTDGKNAGSTYCYSGQWFHFMNGGKRTVFYDLGKLAAVKSYSFNFLQQTEWGISAPEVITVMLSADGQNWYKAAESVKKDNGSTGAYAIKYSGEFDKAYQARFVAIMFSVGSHAFADEFIISGTKNVSGATKLKDSSLGTVILGGTRTPGYQAPSADLLGGVHDVMLIYHNIKGQSYGKDFFMPYVAYLDTDGKIVDTMFDGYLFLPGVGVMSKGKPTSTNYKEDWDSLYASLFAKGQNFDALEEAAAETANALGLKDYKVKAYASFPYIDATLKSFGDVDGDGKSEDFTNLADRIKVVKWYVERVTAEFNARGYQHIELCGWYWFQEEAGGKEDYITIPAVSEYVHSVGSQLFWIPYYCASGYSDWQELGFDVCCMQPNFAFSANVGKSRIQSAADIIKAYNMCIEMETSGKVLSDMLYFKKYMGYLSGGITCGYMNGCIRMYYQDVGVIAAASKNGDSRIRLVYDYTYQFIKGTLSGPETIKDFAITCDADTVYEGRLAEYSTTAIYKLTLSTQHGSVSICEDGTFYYFPEAGFTGTDSFEFATSNYIDWSGSTKVTITVG